jgi:hypothetical protein
MDEILETIEQHEQELKRSKDGLFMLHEAIMAKMEQKTNRYNKPNNTKQTKQQTTKTYDNEIEMPTPKVLNFLETILKHQKLAYFKGNKASRKDVRAFLDIWGPVARGVRTANEAFRLQNN